MSVVQLPKLDINGRSAEEEATRLHFKKNRPDVPDVEFPPYRFRPYPMAMYREHPETREVESKLVGVVDYDEHDVVHTPLREHNDREHTRWLESGWVNKPEDIQSAVDRLNKAVALAAAHRNYDDRNLGPQARAELDQIEDAADEHVLEVPAPTKRPGRPAKAVEGAAK